MNQFTQGRLVLEHVYGSVWRLAADPLDEARPGVWLVDLFTAW